MSNLQPIFGPPKIKRGTAQGQVAFWDSTQGKWVHTETSEIQWDDTAKTLKVQAAQFGDASNYAKFDADGDFQFYGTADYIVGPNRFAFKYEVDEDCGLYFSQTNARFEFRNINGGSMLSASALTNGSIIAESNKAAGSTLEVINDGNNANRYGISVQAGADDASGQTYYLYCKDGDGDVVGYIENNAGVFQLIDPCDERLKCNIRPAKIDGLGVISAIQLKEFNFKKTPDAPRAIGPIAQDLEKIYPRAVSKSSNGMFGVSREALIMPLIAAVQQVGRKRALWREMVRLADYTAW